MSSRLVDKRPQMSRQLELALYGRGDAAQAQRSGEASAAARAEVCSGITSDLMAKALEASNLKNALKRVRRNKGRAGVDAMTVDELGDHLRRHWPALREQLLAGTYQVQPVLVCHIPKPGGGKRMLGIPTVVDRFIQQALLQVLQDRKSVV